MWFPSSSHSKKNGFTLLEMMLAISVSGVLVALIVGAWIQTIRSSTSVETELKSARDRQTEMDLLQGILEGAKWTSTSLTPQGTLRWEGRAQGFSMWSNKSFGNAPGPIAWVFAPDPSGAFGASGADPRTPATPSWTLDLHQVEQIDLEVLRAEVLSGEDHLQWVRLTAWEPTVPFRPLGLRLRITWKGPEEPKQCVLTRL